MWSFYALNFSCLANYFEASLMVAEVYFMLMILVLMFLQLDVPQNSSSVKDVILYGFRWLLCFILMELMTHLFYYNAFANR